MRCIPAVFLVLAIGLFLPTSSLLAQQSRSADELFPDSTAIYLEVESPPELFDALLNHPLRERIEGMEQVQEFMKSPQFTMAMMGKTLIEKQLGSSWDVAIREITSNGLFLGFDMQTQGVAIVFQADDEAQLKKAAEVFLDLTKMSGDQQPFEIKPYRSAKVADFGDFLVARMGTWFLVSNKQKLAKKIVDNMIDGGQESLASQEWYQSAKELRGDNSAWSAINLKKVRDAGVAKELFAGSIDNPGAELLLGGVLDSLKNAAHASANIRLDDSLQVELSLPFREQWASATREFFYGTKLQGRAPVAIELENTITNLTMYRDFGAWWLAKEDLFSEGIIAQMAEFDSQISTLLAGLDFGEEFLGGLEPGAQLVVTEHESSLGKIPDIKLPGFAVVGQLKDESMTRRIRIAYKNMIGIFNLNLGMEGQAQLDSTTEKLDGISLTSTEYMIEDDAEDGLILYNFSPSLAFVENQMVIASTRELALGIAKQLKSKRIGRHPDSNMRMELAGEQLHQILESNREPLVASNMVEEGNSREEAEIQINAILTAVSFLESAEMDFQVQPEKMTLRIELEFGE